MSSLDTELQMIIGDFEGIVKKEKGARMEVESEFSGVFAQNEKEEVFRSSFKPIVDSLILSWKSFHSRLSDSLSTLIHPVKSITIPLATPKTNAMAISYSNTLANQVSFAVAGSNNSIYFFADHFTSRNALCLLFKITLPPNIQAIEMYLNPDNQLLMISEDKQDGTNVLSQLEGVADELSQEAKEEESAYVSPGELRENKEVPFGVEKERRTGRDGSLYCLSANKRGFNSVISDRKILIFT